MVVYCGISVYSSVWSLLKKLDGETSYDRNILLLDEFRKITTLRMVVPEFICSTRTASSLMNWLGRK